MTQPIALIIDDEPDILELLSITLVRMGIRCETALNVADAMQKVDNQNFNLCLTDMRLPDGDGLELVQYIQNKQPDVPVAVITAHGNMQTAIDAMKLGAFDFLSKPVDLSNLRNIVSNALKVNPEPSGETEDTGEFLKEFIGATPNMKHLKTLILKVAKSQAPVYVKGESGTGKEMVARLIHNNGPRADNPFVAINCGAIPSELMESEFFGHKKGSFTGAQTEKEGLFKAADGGTLFLDEIAELPLAMQVKLLRAIQERSIRPVGSEKEVSVNVRILSASHRDLNELVDKGQFRQDLFYRINVIEISVPPLRERKADIPELVDSFIDRLAKRNQMPKPQITEAAINALYEHSFPGNIRELENILERALTLNTGESLDVDDLLLMGSNSAQGDLLLTDRKDQPLDEYLESIERAEIIKALDQTGNNKTAAAELLGISFRTMRYKCKKLNIE
ncbi:sigma-54-dependent transcriptional regulator [Pleionea sediminis]|uniref:sigma-54-dependent transcriptional regulator n=1 Tax=Pleionea sediminis TaxID=2569479 RepID=UPI001185C31F|nr:sigma-54 dependent transcriptional regulator [Pleionea sediminis]